ncbi:MAG: ATP-dependent RecD-like DNA helicase [Oscillospiraceae bacterium]|nr:ATP-dependent RecD-like DNA helicase [Oscillospiraceae bacterium]
MLCQFEKLLYPKDAHAASAGNYMVAVYRPCEIVRDSSGSILPQFKAVGYFLPVSNHLRYDMKGHWSRNTKHGTQFEVDSYDEVIIPSREGIIGYLSSGQIKGIGPRITEKIYDAYGNLALEVLDKEPDKLLGIPGISQTRLTKICDSYLANRAARDVVAFLTPYGITANRAVKLYKEYGKEAMSIVKEHPYQLCELARIGFKTADKIASSVGFTPLSTERVDAALLYTLTEAESRGHLCMEKHAFIKSCSKLLETPELTEEMLANRAARLVSEGDLVSYQGMVYRVSNALSEAALAGHIHRLLRSACQYEYEDLDQEIDAEERALRVRFAPEQREAVKMALTHTLSIITGGPGIGKTMIQRAILDIYKLKHPKNSIICCAPTGRAARRMEQSTGEPSSTVHKALGLLAFDGGYFGGVEALKADLILADEVSMLDNHLALHLFKAVPGSSQLILIGDADQLPSVGPGAVLSELLASGLIPVVRLDRVFRQNAGSRIAVNAKLIRHGTLSLEYGPDFQFHQSPSIPESAERIKELYLQEVQRYGVDNVALLSPFRQKTETGVNALNEVLRDSVNPKASYKVEAVCGKKLFRQGDKVMQTRNHDDVSNGDIGTITGITKTANDVCVHVDFGDGRVKEYDSADLEMLDLGYATTIHKSQGSEYRSVIINLQCAHSLMLTRPLVYTAITRGKDRVILVGERKALCIAIKKTDTEKRGTCLAHRLQVLSKE